MIIDLKHEEIFKKRSIHAPCSSTVDDHVLIIKSGYYKETRELYSEAQVCRTFKKGDYYQHLSFVGCDFSRCYSIAVVSSIKQRHVDRMHRIVLEKLSAIRTDAFEYYDSSEVRSLWKEEYVLV